MLLGAATNAKRDRVNMPLDAAKVGKDTLNGAREIAQEAVFRTIRDSIQVSTKKD
jgi:hypothetical protein